MNYEVTKMGRQEKNNLSSKEVQSVTCKYTQTFHSWLCPFGYLFSVYIQP